MKKLLVVFFVLLIQPALAENLQTVSDEPPAPVEDLSTAAAPASSQPSQQREAAQNQQPLQNVQVLPSQPAMTPQQRVGRLEQQVKNFTQMDLPSKIDMLQKQLQALRGELEMQAQRIKQLDVQQKKFYEEFDRRLAELGATTLPAANNPSVSGEETMPTRSPRQDVVTSAKNAEMNVYRAALQSLAQQNYPVAMAKLKQYLSAYPKGQYRARAYYWLGQVYYVQGQLKEASWQFKTVTSKFPKSTRAPDASLKLALIHDAQGQPALARKELSQVMVRYPNSKAAAIARKRITSPGKSVQ